MEEKDQVSPYNYHYGTQRLSKCHTIEEEKSSSNTFERSPFGFMSFKNRLSLTRLSEKIDIISMEILPEKLQMKTIEVME